MSTPVEFTYKRAGSRSFAETLEAVESAVRLRGFTVVRRHDLQARLAAKGFVIQPLVILDIALPEGEAHPCKLHVYREGDTVWVTVIRPTVAWGVVGPIGDLSPESAEASMVGVVDDAVG